MSKILELRQQLDSHKITKDALLENTFSHIKKHKHLNAYISLVENYNLSKNNKESLLNNIPYAVKDNINVLDTLTTGGSKFFQSYYSPYNATVIELLNQSGAIPVAKANLDEFGLGGTGTFSGFGLVVNPFDETRITSGSSSGSAVMVANNDVVFALGTDTGDSIRKPSSYLGIVGFKPSYGYVSRFGVFPYSPSLDHVGVLAKSVTDIAIVSDVICKEDKRDFTSQIQNEHYFFKDINNLKKNYKIAYFSNIIEYMNNDGKSLFLESINKIKSHNSKSSIEINPVEYPIELAESISSLYQILSYSEAVSCYQNITGIPFGETINGSNYVDKIIKSRSKYFGNELKKRFVFGSYCTLSDNYNELFLNSKKIRRIIVDTMNDILKEYDFVIMPGSSSYAPTIKELEAKEYRDTIVDDYLQIANFGGLPSITLPMGKVNNNFIGINLTGKINDDKNVLILAKHINYILNQGD